jgi:hypothetical protein
MHPPSKPLPLLALLLGLLGCLALTACALPKYDFFDRLDMALDQFVGQPVTEVISYLGPPDKETKVENVRYFSWQHDETYTSHTSLGPEERTLTCKVWLSVSPDNVVKDADYNGNMGACGYFLRALPEALAN